MTREHKPVEIRDLRSEQPEELSGEEAGAVRGGAAKKRVSKLEDFVGDNIVSEAEYSR
jgi:hypothetical protein